MIRLRLPYPPSTNSLFRNVTARDGKPRGRVPTKRYLTWRRVAENEAMAQQQRSISGPVKVKILLGKPDKRKRDLDNAFKAPLDLLVHMGLIYDDSMVQKLQIEWADVEGAHIEVSAA